MFTLMILLKFAGVSTTLFDNLKKRPIYWLCKMWQALNCWILLASLRRC